MAEKKVVYELEFKSNIDEVADQITKDIKGLDASYDKLNASTKEYNKTLEEQKVKQQMATTARKKLIREGVKLANETKELTMLQNKEVKSEGELMRMNNLLVAKRKRMVVVTKSERAEYNKLTVAIAKNNRTLIKSDKSIGRFQRNVGNYANALKGFAGALGLAGGLMAGIQFMKSSTEAYREQAVAVTKLSTVLKQRTGASNAEIESVLALTAAQQEQGVIGDEIQIAGAQQLATFINQTSSVEELIPAMNNLLAQQKGLNASQGDAVNIGNMFGKVMGGQVGALSRVGITFSEAEEKILKYGNESERAATLASVITNNVGDMNTELAATDLGQLKNVENNLGDLQERVGKGVLPIMVKLKTAFFEAAEWMLKLTEVKLADSLEEERIEVNRLAISLTDSNISLDEREKVLKKLKAISPEIVEGLDNENFSYETLTNNLNNYNDAMINRIVLAKKAAEVEEVMEEAGEKALNRSEIELDLKMQIKKVDDALATSGEDVFIIAGKALEIAREKLKNGQLQGQALSDQYLIISNLELMQVKLTKAIRQEKEARSDLSSIQAEAEELKKQLGIVKEINKEGEKQKEEIDPKPACDAKCQEAKRKKAADAAKKARDVEKKALADLSKYELELLKANLTAKQQIRDANYSDISSLNEEELRDYTEFYIDLTQKELEYAEAKLLSTDKTEQEVARLSKTQHKAYLTERLVADKNYETEVATIKKKSADFLRTLQIQDLDEEYRLKFENLFKIHSKERELLGANAEEKRAAADTNAQIDMGALESQYDWEVEALREKFGKDYETNKEYNEVLKILNEERADAEIEIAQRTADEKVRINQEEQEQKAVSVQNFFAAITKSLELWDNIDSASKAAELKRAGDNEQKIAAIENEYAEKKKQRAIASILVDTAMAIMGVWAQNPNPVYGGIMTALLAGISIAQVSAVQSQPTSFAGGGLLQGPLHAQGGISYGNDEVEGNEFIMNRASTAAFYPLIESLNAAGNNQGRTSDVKDVNIIDYDKLAGLINDKRVYVTTKDLNESLDDDDKLKVDNTF